MTTTPTKDATDPASGAVFDPNKPFKTRDGRAVTEFRRVKRGIGFLGYVDRAYTRWDENGLMTARALDLVNVEPASPVTPLDERGSGDAEPVAFDPSRGFHLYRDGSHWCAVGPRFVDLGSSKAGFGLSQEKAVLALKNVTNVRDWPHPFPDVEKFKVWNLTPAFPVRPLSKRGEAKPEAEAPLKSIIDTATSERTMELWDCWRAMLLDGDLGDAPRLGFESILSAVQTDAEDALAALRATPTWLPSILSRHGSLGLPDDPREAVSILVDERAAGGWQPISTAPKAVEAVAWQVKSGEKWLLCPGGEAQARAESHGNGNAPVRPLYASPKAALARTLARTDGGARILADVTSVIEDEYAKMSGKRCSTERARKLAQDVLETAASAAGEVV